jgi:hypothetical protein
MGRARGRHTTSSEPLALKQYLFFSPGVALKKLRRFFIWLGPCGVQQ